MTSFIWIAKFLTKYNNSDNYIILISEFTSKFPLQEGRFKLFEFNKKEKNKFLGAFLADTGIKEPDASEKLR